MSLGLLSLCQSPVLQANSLPLYADVLVCLPLQRAGNTDQHAYFCCPPCSAEMEKLQAEIAALRAELQSLQDIRSDLRDVASMTASFSSMTGAYTRE